MKDYLHDLKNISDRNKKEIQEVSDRIKEIESILHDMLLPPFELSIKDIDSDLSGLTVDQINDRLGWGCDGLKRLLFYDSVKRSRKPLLETKVEVRKRMFPYLGPFLKKLKEYAEER